jgi:hypothetical protein
MTNDGQPKKRHVVRNVLLSSGGVLVLLVVIGAIVGSPKPKPAPAGNLVSTSVTASTSVPAIKDEPSAGLSTSAAGLPAVSSSAVTAAAPPVVVPATSPRPQTSRAAVTTHSANSVAAPPPAPASCHPLTNGGKCYEPGEFCRDSDHGVTGLAGDGETITCEDNDGWRWEPS